MPIGVIAYMYVEVLDIFVRISVRTNLITVENVLNHEYSVLEISFSKVYSDDHYVIIAV